MPNSSPNILYFDGVCGLCNRSVDFVLHRDREQQFLFAPLQGETAAENLSAEELADLNSLVLQTPSGLYRRSAAVVRILWKLGGFWAVLGALLWIIPLPLRNLGYRAVSATRYWLFGKKESCRVPTPEERDRFLP
jgi:predicted DCC family thiol-disulfide oxidoreductase YuxK